MARYGADANAGACCRMPGIVRNRLKVDAFIANAKAYLKIRAQGSFDDYLWRFTGGRTLRRRPLYLGGIAVSTPQSDAMSRDLKRARFPLCRIDDLPRLHAGGRHRR
jgi:DNA-3-methyladenine glycosylase I